jgi:hypothetical protein
MKTANAMLWIAHYMPEWMYGRIILAKMAIGYMLINSMSQAHSKPKGVLYA